MPAPPCQPGCTCGKHVRTAQHNARIAISCALTVEAKKRTGEKINQHG